MVRYLRLWAMALMATTARVGKGEIHSQILCSRVVTPRVWCSLLVVGVVDLSGSNPTALLVIAFALEDELFVVCVFEVSQLA